MIEYKMRVLLVEPNDADALMLRRLLKDAPNVDLDLSHVQNLGEAKARLANGNIDVMLLDMSLPDSRGLQAIVSMNDFAPSVPIVALTSVSDNGLSLEAVRASAQDYIVKEQANSRLLIRTLRYAIDRKQSQEQVRQSEEQYRRIVELAQEGIWMIDAQSITSFINKKLAEMFGYTIDEMMGRPLFDFMDEEGRVLATANIERRKQGISEQHEFKFRCKDGSDLWTNLSTNPIFDDKGIYSGALAMVTDITQRKKADDQLRKLSHAVEQSPASIIITDTSGSIEYVNPKFTRITGYSAEEVLGKNPRVLRSGYTATEEYRGLWEAITAGGEWRGEFHNKRKDGELFWEFASISPVRNTAGTITHFVGVKEDITERKQAQEALQKSEEQYRMLFESNPHPMWVYEIDTLAFLAVNDAAIAKYGYSRDEFLKLTIKGIRPEEDIPRLIKNVQRVREGLDEAGNWRHRKKDGTIIDVEIISHTVLYEGKRAELILATDITERKQAEEKLRLSEERYRLLFEENVAGNFISTPDGVLLSCNPAFARIFGFASIEEAMQNNVISLYPEDSQREALMTQLRADKRIDNCEKVLRRRDGTLMHAILSVIGTFNTQGELVEIKGYLFDDSKRKELEAQMTQLQKMESIGTLAGGIAHDFNNILGIILGNATMLDVLTENPVKLSRSIENIKKAVVRGSGLVRQILTFARKTNVLFEPLQLNDLIKEMAQMLEGTFPKTIALSLELGKNIPLINADRTQLHQTFLNLCVNARDAMPDGGTLIIRTNTSTPAELRVPGRDATVAEYIHVCISDTGIGMDEATKQRVFEPFFTTKEIGKGTGIGLSVVYGIMKSHDGFVEVETAPGHGTTFHLYFPTPETTAEVDKNEQEKTPDVGGGGETILLVEDEDMLRELVSNLLQTKGYRVLTAVDGITGAAVYAQEKEHIALVVTDMGLPLMSGLEMIKKIREMNPAAKVILASGYLPPEDKLELENIGAQEYLEKPYLPDELFRKIRQVIDGSAVAPCT